MEATNERKSSTARSAVAIILVAVLVVAIGVALYYAFTVPGIMESVTNILAIAGVVILAVIGIIALLAAVLAVPMYAYKGERYQENVNYNLDDIQPAENKKDRDDPPKF